MNYIKAVLVLATIVVNVEEAYIVIDGNFLTVLWIETKDDISVTNNMVVLLPHFMSDSANKVLDKDVLVDEESINDTI